jgi:sigma-B regulation protein RsbU (phosphoserine phosphatase)
MTGPALLERIKAHDELRELPVIMISALDELDSVIKCIELGAEDYLPKPFNPTLLRARVGASIEKRRLRDALQANLKRLEAEMTAARRLQLGMLPHAFPPRTPDRPIEVHAVMEPASEVGGDLYDCFYASDDLFCFLVGDVSGKGAHAAMFMARARSLVRLAIELWRQLSPEPISLARIAGSINAELCQNNDECMFVTLFIGLIDTGAGTLAYLNAGHPPPALLRVGGDIEGLGGEPATPLGARRDSSYESRSVSLHAGDAVLVTSDGITEARNPDGEYYGEAQLARLLDSLRERAPDRIVSSLIDDVGAFTGGQPAGDDVTVLALRWNPA